MFGRGRSNITSKEDNEQLVRLTIQTKTKNPVTHRTTGHNNQYTGQDQDSIHINIQAFIYKLTDWVLNIHLGTRKLVINQ